MSFLGSELLELDGLSTVTHPLLVLKLLECFLSFKSSVEQLQVPLLFRQFCLLPQQLLLLVVMDQAEVALANQNLTLQLNLLLAFFFLDPLSFKHLPLDSCLLLFLALDSLFGLLLPVQNSKSVSIQLLLLLRLCNLSL